MDTEFGLGDPFDEVSVSSIYSLLFVLRVQYPYVLPFVTPEDVLQNIPVSILPPPFPFVAPRDVLQNGLAPILAPAFPDLAYPYEFFGNPFGLQLSQEIETALNPFLPPCYDPIPSGSSTQTTPPASDTARPSAICSVPIPSSPVPAPSQNATGYSSNRRKIPQTVYGWGKKRWDYLQLEPILFHVNGHPGVNMGGALRDEFTGLDGRDDLMFQDGVDAFSCRLMVRSLRQFPPPVRIDGPTQFPGYPVNSKSQVGMFARVALSGTDYCGRFLQSTGIGIALQ